MVQNRHKVKVRKELKKTKGEKGINPGWVKGVLGGPWSQMLKIALPRSLKCEYAEHTKCKMKFTGF